MPLPICIKKITRRNKLFYYQTSSNWLIKCEFTETKQNSIQTADNYCNFLHYLQFSTRRNAFICLRSRFLRQKLCTSIYTYMFIYVYVNSRLPLLSVTAVLKDIHSILKHIIVQVDWKKYFYSRRGISQHLQSIITMKYYKTMLLMRKSTIHQEFIKYKTPDIFTSKSTSTRSPNSLPIEPFRCFLCSVFCINWYYVIVYILMVLRDLHFRRPNCNRVIKVTAVCRKGNAILIAYCPHQVTCPDSLQLCICLNAEMIVIIPCERSRNWFSSLHRVRLSVLFTGECIDSNLIRCAIVGNLFIWNLVPRIEFHRYLPQYLIGYCLKSKVPFNGHL